MTPKQAKALDHIWAAYRDGKVVQCRQPKAINSLWHEWRDYSWNAVNWHVALCSPAMEWRIKPEPVKPREWWLCPTCRACFSGLDPFIHLVKERGCMAHACPDKGKPMVLVKEVLAEEGT